MNNSNFQHPITELKNAHRGEDIWVIASGASMDFVKPDFFTNKITVGVNQVNRRFDCDYIVAKDTPCFDNLLKFRKKAKIVLSRYDCGDTGKSLNEVEHTHWVFDHLNNPINQAPDLTVVGSDQLVVSYSTITSAIHLAAYLGARNIIVCGHDCGAINGAVNFKDYYNKADVDQDFDIKYYHWLSKIEQQTIKVTEQIQENYEISVHSLNPFLSFNLDGNTFESYIQKTSNRFMISESVISKLAGFDQQENQQLIESLNQMDVLIKERDQWIKERDQVIKKIHESVSFRLGRGILAPLRLIQKVFTRFKN